MCLDKGSISTCCLPCSVQQTVALPIEPQALPVIGETGTCNEQSLLSVCRSHANKQQDLERQFVCSCVQL